MAAAWFLSIQYLAQGACSASFACRCTYHGKIEFRPRNGHRSFGLMGLSLAATADLVRPVWASRRFDLVVLTKDH
jgi:hypothetical protein